MIDLLDFTLICHTNTERIFQSEMRENNIRSSENISNQDPISFDIGYLFQNYHRDKVEDYKGEPDNYALV